MCKIVPYNDSYKDEVIQLILNIQVQEFNISVSIKDQPDLENISTIYQNGSGNFWVAIDNNKVVGTIAIMDIENDQVALRKMFVNKQHRGKEKGIAQALLTELLNWCKTKKIREIYLGTTAAFLAAHRFYEKNGFQEISPSELPSSFSIMKVDSKFYKYSF